MTTWTPKQQQDYIEALCDVHKPYCLSPLGPLLPPHLPVPSEETLIAMASGQNNILFKIFHSDESSQLRYGRPLHDVIDPDAFASIFELFRCANDRRNYSKVSYDDNNNNNNKNHPHLRTLLRARHQRPDGGTAPVTCIAAAIRNNIDSDLMGVLLQACQEENVLRELLQVRTEEEGENLTCFDLIVRFKSCNAVEHILEASSIAEVDRDLLAASKPSTMYDLFKLAINEHCCHSCFIILFEYFDQVLFKDDRQQFRQFLCQRRRQKVDDNDDEEECNFLWLTISNLYDSDAFKLFWKYFHTELDCLGTDPSLFFHASPSPKTTTEDGDVVANDTQHLLKLTVSARCRTFEDWQLIIDACDQKGVLRDLVQERSEQCSQKFFINNNANSTVNLFQWALAKRDVREVALRALNYAFKKCGMCPVQDDYHGDCGDNNNNNDDDNDDISLSEKRGILKRSPNQNQPNCIHTAIAASINRHGFAALIEICDEYGMTRDLLKQVVEVDDSQINQYSPPRDSSHRLFTWKSRGIMNCLHLAIRSHLPSRSMDRLCQLLHKYSLFQSQFRAPTSDFLVPSPSSSSSSSSSASTEVSTVMLALDATKFNTGTYTALVCNNIEQAFGREFCLWDLGAPLFSSDNLKFVFRETNHSSTSTATSTSIEDEQNQDAAPNASSPPRLTPLQKKSFTIPNIQRIAKFAVLQRSQSFTLAYVNRIFQETMVDFHTSHITFSRSAVLSDKKGAGSVREIGFIIFNPIIPSWILQEVLLKPLPGAEKDDDQMKINRYYEILKETFCRKMFPQLLYVVETLHKNGRTDESYELLKFSLAYFPCIKSELKRGRYLIDVIETYRLSEKHLDLLIRAHIECGLWTRGGLFPSYVSYHLAPGEPLVVDEDFEDYETIPPRYDRLEMTDETFFSRKVENGDMAVAIVLLMRLLLSENYSADIITLFFVNLFPGSALQRSETLMRIVHTKISKWDNTRMSPLVSAATDENCSVEKLEILVRVLDEVGNLANQLLFDCVRFIEPSGHEDDVRVLSLQFLIAHASSLEKLKVILDRCKLAPPYFCPSHIAAAPSRALFLEKLVSGIPPPLNSRQEEHSYSCMAPLSSIFVVFDVRLGFTDAEREETLLYLLSLILPPPNETDDNKNDNNNNNNDDTDAVDSTLIRDFLLQGNCFLLDQSIQAPFSLEFIQKILELYKQHNLLSLALTSNLGIPNNNSIWDRGQIAIFHLIHRIEDCFVMHRGRESACDFLRLFLKAHADCGVLDETLGNKNVEVGFETADNFYLVSEAEHRRRGKKKIYPLELFCVKLAMQYHSEGEEEVSMRLDCVRVFVAHFKSPEMFREQFFQPTGTTTNDQIAAAATAADQPPKRVTMLDKFSIQPPELKSLLLTSPDKCCWQECRNWFKERYGEWPPMDRESGKRRERD